MVRLLSEGILVAMEGIDGAGKTTQAECLAKRLEQDGFKVIRTKEPTAGQWGQQLRDSAHSGRLPPSEELELFVRDRREHVANVINPALKAGTVVIVDRYYFSTVAYQGARGMDPSKLLELNESFAPCPNLTILLEVSVATGQARIRARGDVANLFEAEAELERAAAIFAALKRPGLRRMDGELPVNEIAGEILYTFYEGPLLLRATPPSTTPSISPARVPEFLSEVERIRANTTISDSDKANAILQALTPYLV